MFDLLSIAGGAMSDLLTADQFAASGTAGAAFQSILQGVMRSRADRARSIFLEEVRAGQRDLSDHEPDEVVSIIYRYMRAAQEGAAAINLRLMARVVAGQTLQREIYADDFLRDAAVLSHLSRDEVVFLATVYRVTGGAGFRGSEEGRGVHLAGPQAIPLLYPTSRAFEESCSYLQRTGYLRAHPALAGQSNYTTTRAYERLVRLVRFDDWNPALDPTSVRPNGRGAQ